MQNLSLDQIESKIIKTQDENGEYHNFELIDIVNYNEQDYGLLVYLDKKEENKEDEEGEEDEEIIIMRLNKQDDSYSFETIEDDKEFDNIVSFLEGEDYLSELFDDEDEDDDDYDDEEEDDDEEELELDEDFEEQCEENDEENKN
ncbi:MAG: DUF1292 domain-containing protein [bacterium]